MRVCVIDTTPAAGFALALIESGVILKKVVIAEPFQEAEHLIPCIEKILADGKFSPHDIDELWVVRGPGRFTAVRIGVAVANAWAYANTIPLRAIERSSPYEEIEDMVERFMLADTVYSVEPIYGKDPNITLRGLLPNAVFGIKP